MSLGYKKPRIPFISIITIQGIKNPKSSFLFPKENETNIGTINLNRFMDNKKNKVKE